MVVVALLVLPLWWWQGQAAKQREQVAIEQKANAVPPTQPGPPLPAAQAEPPRNSHGLTYGVLEPVVDPSTAAFSCHGEPKAGLERPHKGSCNPYSGDTACNVVLPVLCVNGQALGATAAVMGAILNTQAVGDARCAAELGNGWRMAAFHDNPSGWELGGRRGPGLQSGTRYWVAIGDQPGNCWSPKS